MRVSAWLIRSVIRTLEPDLQDAVAGDVAELKMDDRRAVCELLGLALRRQAMLWRSWKPWLGLVGIVGPVGVILSRISVGVVGGLSMQFLIYWQYGVPYSSELTEFQEFESLVCGALAVICFSWVGGFVLGTLSGNTLYVSRTLFCLVWFCLCGPLWTLIILGRLLLNALHLVPLGGLAVHNFGVFDLIIFLPFPLILELLLFLLPALAGMRRGRRGRELGMLRTLLLTVTVATLTALVTWMGGWRQVALERWSEGTWNPGGPSWQARLVPLLVVSWPVLYLLAVCVRNRSDKSQSLIG